MVILAIMAHLALLMEDQGYQVQTASFMVAVYTGVAMCFQLVGGYVGDRASKRLTLAFFTCIQAAGVVVLVFANTLPMFYFFAILFGIGFGGRNPLTVAIPRGVFRYGVLRQDSGAVHGADERTAADRRAASLAGCTTPRVTTSTPF